MSESTKNIGKVADFIVKIIMMFSTILVLLVFANNGNQTLFSILIGIFLVAIIVKGVSDIFDK